MSPLRIGGWTAIALTAALLVVWPLIELIAVAAETWDLSRVESTSLINSLLVGVGASVVATALGVAAAIATQRFGGRGGGLLRIGILLPFLVPPFVSAIGFVRGYGPGGYLEDITGQDLPGVFGPMGIVAVVAINALPLAYLITLAALRSRRGPEMEMASRSSGGGPVTTSMLITIPLVSSAVFAASALVFVVGINAFGVPAVLGTPAGFDTMTTGIYQDLALSARPESFSRAIVTALALVAIAIAFVVAGEALLSRSRIVFGGRSSTSTTNRRMPFWVGAIVMTLVFASTVAPLLSLLATAFTRGVGLAPLPGNLTLDNFQEALSPRLLPAFGRSVLLAGLAATAATLLGMAATTLRPSKARSWSARLPIMGFAVPGSTLAVAVLLAYGPPLRDTLLLIGIAYVAKLWAVGHRTIEGSQASVTADLRNAARASGASESDTFRTIVIPMLRPAIAAGWFLVFLFAFHEVTMSSLLYGPGSETLAVQVLNVQQLGDVPLSSALALILTAPLLVVALPSFRHRFGTIR